VIRFTPLRPDPGAPLAGANPVAKLAAAALLMTALFVSRDLLTPLLVLAGLAACLPLTGLPAGALLGRSWPLLLAALSVGVLNVIFGAAGFSAEAVTAGAALGLRLLAIALSGLLALVSSDPTDLADALQQQARLPSRLAVGALAAVRLLPILAGELQVLRLARRARGIEAGRSPLAAARLAGGLLLALLVGAVRRGTRLAAAMESRGFGARPCRSLARPTQMRPADWGWIAAAALLGGGAVAVGVATGVWRFAFGQG
jgi:energy-coupling factor transport system permease protein